MEDERGVLFQVEAATKVCENVDEFFVCDDWCPVQPSTPNSQQLLVQHMCTCPQCQVHACSNMNCPVTTRGTAYLMYLQSTQDRVSMPMAYNTRQRATSKLSLAPFEENGQQFERPVDPRSAVVGGLCPVLRQAFGRAVPNFFGRATRHVELLSNDGANIEVLVQSQPDGMASGGRWRALAGRTWH